MADGIKFRFGAEGINEVDAAGAKVQQRMADIARQAGITQGQLNAAMRTVPAQMTDIATQLAGGQNPMLILLQQGGQLKDSFGGLMPMLRSIGTMVTTGLTGPLTMAALAAAGVGYAIYNSVTSEIDQLTRAQAKTGGQIGLTTSQLQAQVTQMTQLAHVTRGTATDALTLMIEHGGVSAEAIERITTAALRLESVGGPSVKATAELMGDLARAPLEASIKLNAATGHLTLATYDQIKALMEQGRVTEAARLAQDAAAASAEQQAAKIEASMGTLQKQFRDIANDAKAAWNAISGGAVPATLDEQLKAAEARLADLQARRKSFVITDRYTWTEDGVRSVSGVLPSAQADVDRLRAAKQLEDQRAAASAQTTAQVKARVAYDAIANQFLKDEVKMQRELTIARNAAAAAGVSTASKSYQDLEAQIREKYKPKSTGNPGDQNAAERTMAQEWAKDYEAFAKAEDDARNKADGLTASQGRMVDMLTSPAYQQWPESMRQAVVQQGIAAITAEQHAQAQRDAAKALADLERAHDAYLRELVSSAAAVSQQVQVLQDEESAAAMAARSNITLAQAIQLVAIQRLQEEQAKQMSYGDNAAVAALQAEIDKRRELAGLQDAKNQRAAGTKAYEDFMGLAGKGTDMASGFDAASQSMGKLVEQFQRLAELRAKYAAAEKTGTLTAAQWAEMNRANARAQVGTYAAMTGAAKGFFREGSKGYRAMEAAEKTLRAFELGEAIAVATKKIGLFQDVTAAAVTGNETVAASSVKAATVDASASSVAGTAAASAAVAGQAAKGDPYTAWARMAAMVAAMAALGYVVGGGSSGSGGSSTSRYVTGSGTTLGDNSAASTSLGDSLKRLTEVDTLTMQYSGQMLAALRSIDAGINGLGSQITRDLSGGSIAGADWAKAVGLSFDQRGPQTMADIRANGLQLNDTAARSAAFDAVLKRTRDSYAAAAAANAATSSYADDFQAVLERMANSLESVAGPLGMSAEQVQAALASVNVQIDNINLKDKTSDQIAEVIAAALSKAGDQLAAGVLPGFDRFSQLGEAYYQTVVRVGTGVEEAQAALAPLALTMADLATVAGGAKDVGAELVRNTITARETTAGLLSTVGQLVQGLDGSAADLVDTYTTLVDARRTLGALGVQSSALTSDLLAGAGGLDGLTSSLESYTSWALTDGERLAITTGKLRDGFAALGVAMPATVADYKDLVDGIDTSTEAGQRLLGQVLGLADSYSELASAQQAIADERQSLQQQLWEAEGNTAAQREYELSQLDESNRALQQRIWALRDEAEAANELVSAGGNIVTFINELRGASSSSSSLSQLRATYASELAAAQGGDSTASANLVETARDLVAALKAQSTDAISYARDTARIAAQLSALPATLAYQADQAGTATAQALASASLSASTASASVSGAAASSTTSSAATVQSSLLAELQSLRDELAAMRTEQRTRADAIATATTRAASMLDDVTQGGNAVRVVAGG